MSNDAGKVQALPLEVKGIDVLDSLRGKVPDEIFAQLEERVQLGVRKYGQRLTTDNGRDVLLDCLQECLDGIMYGQQAKLQGIDDFVEPLVDRFTALAMVINHLRERKAQQ